MRALDVLTSSLASLTRLNHGGRRVAVGPRPDKPLELYEFESCPFCRKVREALSVLDLDVVIYPCPKGGTRYRNIVKEKGGKAQFPYLVDPNFGVQMYESDAIITHLFDKYGAGRVPLSIRGPWPVFSGSFTSLLRLGKDDRRKSRAPERPLELYSFESCPFCRIAREALCGLELPYVLHNIPRGSDKRKAFLQDHGKTMFPYLVDPNTGEEMFESADIVNYLRRTYG